jgi:tRNA (guanine-N7-)-methyltransferase
MVDLDEPSLGAPAKRPRPYADAPTLPGPADGPVDVRKLVAGATFELEIGPGRGGFVFERLVAAPEAGFVGLEVRRKWASVVDARLTKQGFAGRARIFAEDAKHVLARLGPDAVFSHVFVHFPDPWWKKRHKKRLLLDPALLVEIARLLGPRGELFVQTDVEDRAAEYQALIDASPGFRPAGDFASSPRLAANPYDAQSPRERRAVQDGLPVHRLRYRRA